VVNLPLPEFLPFRVLPVMEKISALLDKESDVEMNHSLQDTSN
jgi:hypothetical protein